MGRRIGIVARERAGWRAGARHAGGKRTGAPAGACAAARRPPLPLHHGSPLGRRSADVRRFDRERRGLLLRARRFERRVFAHRSRALRAPRSADGAAVRCRGAAADGRGSSRERIRALVRTDGHCGVRPLRRWTDARVPAAEPSFPSRLDQPDDTGCYTDR